jgi:GT2 family glycosyltransferase
VVLFRNDPDELSLLLRSLEAARAFPSAPPATVRFLDNSPDDALRAALAAQGMGEAYRHAGRNAGFGAAQNELMAAAFADPAVQAYLCLNPDAVLHPACLGELWAQAQRQGFGLCEALQFPDEHAKPWDAQTQRTPWCSGCCLLVSRALYERIGGFDERFFLYAEDVDLSWRARQAGFAIGVAPRALVHHSVVDRSDEHKARSRAQMDESGALLRKKWGRSRVADFAHGRAYARKRW